MDHREAPGRLGRALSPAFCPNPRCRHHLDPSAWRYRREGFYRRPSDRRRIQRYRCRSCRRYFSDQTFAADYWLRRRALLPRIASLSTICTAIRQMARELGCAPETVARQLARLGRHSLLFHSREAGSARADEPLVADGFESFEYSQYFPYHLNLAVGAQSWFCYHVTDSPLRRKGRMTAHQKSTRMRLEAQLGRPRPQAVREAMTELFANLLRRNAKVRQLEIRTDQHRAYPPALAAATRSLGGVGAVPRIVHHTVSSRAARTVQNPLFAVNRLDLLIRHCGANHKRETIAFNRRRQAGIERLMVLLVYLNWIKRRREKGRDARTPAVVKGLASRALSWADVLKERLFPDRIRLEGSWRAYYERRITTSVYGYRCRRHSLRYAF